MNTQERIVFTAYKLFVKRGYSAVSINDIIKEACISKGGFYHHFTSKEGLLEAVLEVYLYQYYEQLISYFTTEEFSPAAKLKNIFNYLLEFDEKFREEMADEELEETNYALLVMEAVKLFLSIREKVSGYEQRILKVVADTLRIGQTTGELRKNFDCEGMAIALLSMVNGLYDMSLFDSEFDTDNAHRKVQDIFWNMIKPESSVISTDSDYSNLKSANERIGK
ncbi:hypothetical protein CEE37_14085 [candidate division LCP-89 bacterium B3_LCP]|uniref:HTH tetR-type domain-containing protein n=1 Tax=candidate division LCP-89 bacterium B3_LCP TaxID=2012998 RepID=A0A532UQM3_UNCL8|nr:MAG: hypothetical protein CEE37_14085 [candidate division LCP-89 bacterium B3_LCP]